MNISMTPQLEAYVHRQVKSGMYQSVSEMVRAAVRLHANREKMRKKALSDLDNKIQIGLDQIARGEYSTEVEFKKEMAEFRRKKLAKRG